MANDMDIGNSVRGKIFSSVYDINDLSYNQINVDDELFDILWNK